MSSKEVPQPHTIVIGSGIAGLNFALNAAEYGPVLIVTKKRTVESSTNYAQGGIAAVLDKADDFERHVEDTMKAGQQHNVKAAVEFMVKKGPEAIMRLIEFGVKFATDEEGHLLLTREGGHDGRRIAFVGDYTGQEIERALIEKVTTHPQITIWEHTFAVDLLIEDNQCYGVQVVHNNEVKNIQAHHTVLATGGAGQVYQYTTNPSISTGDGMAMAIRAGLKIKDMEFIQFHPTAFKHGSRTKFLLSEALRGEGAYLLNKNHERFMNSKHKLKELAPRDIVAQAVYEQDLNGGAFLDIHHEPSKAIKLRFPQIYQYLKKEGYDLTQEPIPIAPAAHYTCGGIPINRKGETKIQNLYAFGEVSWTGVHGANRLASNSLLEALVFSSQILPQLKEKQKSKPHFSKAPTFKSLSPGQQAKLNQLKQKIRQIMWQDVGIIRSPQKVQEAIEKLTEIESKFQTIEQELNGLNVKLKEAQNMALVGKAIAGAAKKRKESLGCHHVV